MPFARPTTTATPDEIFEEWVHVLRHAELLALLYVVRRTLGFKKVEDGISYSQFLNGITTREGKVLDRGCGIKSRGTLAAALRRLEELSLIRSHKTQDARGDRATTRYSLWFTGDEDHDRPSRHTSAPDCPAEGGPAPIEPRWYADRTTPSAQIEPPLVRASNQQQTDETTNTRQQTDLSRRKARAIRVRPPLDSTDSTSMIKDDIMRDESTDPAVLAVSTRVAHLSTEFGDDAPQASQTRVINMQRAAGLGDDVLLALLDDAATIARSPALAITKRGRAGAIIRMPYLLATLRGLVEATNDHVVPAPPMSSMAVRPSPVIASLPDLDDLPVTTAAEVMWRAVRDEVRRDVTVENYAAWFVPTRAIALEGDVLRVMAPTPFHRQWLEHKLHGCVERALQRVGHARVHVAYDSATPDDAAPTGDQAIAQGVAPPVPAPSPCATPPTPASSSATFAAASPSRPTIASCAVSLLVVACPSCRAVPCRCRLADQLRRVIAARAAPVRGSIPGP